MTSNFCKWREDMLSFRVCSTQVNFEKSCTHTAAAAMLVYHGGAGGTVLGGGAYEVGRGVYGASLMRWELRGLRGGAYDTDRV